MGTGATLPIDTVRVGRYLGLSGLDVRQRLLERLIDIGRSLERSGQALALLGLGSVGVETDRLDEYSDLDFFVIAEDGARSRYVDSLDWLEAVYPIDYAFKNTSHGYKAMFADGIYCEVDIFEPQEMASTPYAPGRIVWKRDTFPTSFGAPSSTAGQLEEQGVEWMVGEILTNLYVGLGRERRGERLSANRFIQSYAIDRIVGLSPHVEAEQSSVPRDIFIGERRYEQRFPALAARMSQFVQGYDRNDESAFAILTFLEEHFEVNAAIKAAILQRCEL